MQPTLPEKPIRKPRTKASSRRRAVLEEGRSNLHITRLFPNIVTILALCFGLSAMRYALSDRWELSVSFIVIAAILDGLDGRLARLLNATSDFGAHLDSLVDFVNFGVAPAFVLYLWGMHEIRAFGWGIALFYSICCVIRLARFNTTLEEDEPPFWFDYFFSGVPSPIGALLALAPLIAVIGLKDESPEMLAQINWLINPFSVCLYVAVIGILMASRLPTISFKKATIPRAVASLALVIVGMFLILAFTQPWLSLMLILCVYLLTLPYSLFRFHQMKRKFT